MISPLFFRELPMEENLSLFDYFAQEIGKPITSNLLTVRSVQSYSTEYKNNLNQIFDDRNVGEVYWTNLGSVENPYLDFEIHYHHFVPSHVRIHNYETTNPKNLKISCGRYFDSLTVILNIQNPKAKQIYEIDSSLYNGELCKFFRYQMIGKNSISQNYFDMMDFDLYGDLYAVSGMLDKCSFLEIHGNKHLEIVFVTLALNIM